MLESIEVKRVAWPECAPNSTLKSLWDLLWMCVKVCEGTSSVMHQIRFTVQHV